MSRHSRTGALVTVIIPAFNEADYIGPTLEALFEAVGNYEAAGGRAEVVVVDNASTDATVAAASSFPVRIVREEKRQIAAVRNRGAAEARGANLIFLDADSHPSPNALVRICGLLSTGGYAGGGVRILPGRWTLGTLWVMPLMPILQVVFGVSGGMIFCTREAFDAIGGFDESFYAAEDLDFVLRLKDWGLRRALAFGNLADVQIRTSMRKLSKATLADFLIFPHYLLDKSSVKRRENCALWYNGAYR